jgi:hypothetical protein
MPSIFFCRLHCQIFSYLCVAIANTEKQFISIIAYVYGHVAVHLYSLGLIVAQGYDHEHFVIFRLLHHLNRQSTRI